MRGSPDEARSTARAIVVEGLSSYRCNYKLNDLKQLPAEGRTVLNNVAIAGGPREVT